CRASGPPSCSSCSPSCSCCSAAPSSPSWLDPWAARRRSSRKASSPPRSQATVLLGS
ncbi:MAG: Twin-arginine translocation protein TatA, partial [uncultured Acidimicrobiales bacterium]